MTVQNLYTQYLDGKITKQKFLYEVRRDQHLDMISSSNSFDDVVKILKNKSIISEKAHKEAKLATGKQEVDIIAKTIDMVNPYEYSRGMDYELDIMDVPASTGDLSDDNVLKAQKKVLANLTKNPSFYFDKINGKGEVSDEWVEATKKEIDKIGKGKKNIMREGYTPNQKVTFINTNDGNKYEGTVVQDLGNGRFTFRAEDGKVYGSEGLGSNWTIKTNEAFEGGFVSRGAILKALEDVGNESEIRQYLTSLEKSGDKFETTDDYIEDFRNYIADKSLEEHGDKYDKVSNVNPLTQDQLEERQRAIYEKYCEKTGIPMENLMSMVREAKAKKVEEATTAKTSDPIHNADVLKSISKVSNTTAKAELTKAFNAGKTIDV